MKTEPELIPQGDCWLVRSTEEAGKLRGEVIVNRRTKHELVYGHWEPNFNKEGHITGHKVLGEAFHTLTGPNGKLELEKLADQYNKEGKKPPEKVPETRLEGWKQSHDQSGGNSLFDCVTLQRCISFKPEDPKANPF